jgi:S-formylglutathione hydrolase FrmB
MQPWPRPLTGRLDKLTISSDLLRENPLGDPHERPLWVYLPPGYDDQAGRLPTVYMLHGYGGSVASWGNRPVYGQPFIEMADQAFATGQAEPAVVVFVDGWNRYGGSQYIDSPGTGQYLSYLCDEIVPYVDGSYRTIAAREHRAAIGKSSGGFGALVAAMLRPDVFGGCASHAGDACYEALYSPWLPRIVRALAPYDGDIMAWWRDFQQRLPAVFSEQERAIELMLGVAACFSPGANGVPLLPMDTTTGEIRPDVWQKWLAWDPVRMIPGHAEQLRALRGIWIDAGSADEFFLDLGAKAMHRALTEIGLPDGPLHFDIVPGADHEAIGRRQVSSLCWLTARLGVLSVLTCGIASSSGIDRCFRGLGPHVKVIAHVIEARMRDQRASQRRYDKKVGGSAGDRVGDWAGGDAGG